MSEMNERSGAAAGSIAKDAAARGMELALIPMKDVPPLALDFLRHLAKKVGMCGEVCITAFAVYAQCVEGLTCSDYEPQSPHSLTRTPRSRCKAATWSQQEEVRWQLNQRSRNRLSRRRVHAIVRR